MVATGQVESVTNVHKDSMVHYASILVQHCAWEAVIRTVKCAMDAPKVAMANSVPFRAKGTVQRTVNN